MLIFFISFISAKYKAQRTWYWLVAAPPHHPPPYHPQPLTPLHHFPPLTIPTPPNSTWEMVCPTPTIFQVQFDDDLHNRWIWFPPPPLLHSTFLQQLTNQWGTTQHSGQLKDHPTPDWDPCQNLLTGTRTGSVSGCAAPASGAWPQSSASDVHNILYWRTGT